jgi:hypothetical protein
MKLSFSDPESTRAWEDIKTNWLIRNTGRVVLSTSVGSLTGIALLYTQLPPLIPLWYSRPWGVDQLAHPLWLLVFPAGSICIFFINRMITKYFVAQYLIFSQILFLTSLVSSILSLFALMKILLLIT